jgi:hypothetical protein
MKIQMNINIDLETKTKLLQRKIEDKTFSISETADNLFKAYLDIPLIKIDKKDFFKLDNEIAIAKVKLSELEKAQNKLREPIIPIER